MNRKNKDLEFYLMSALTGFIVCLSISIITGRREAWDSGIYFYLGIPAMSVMAFFLAKKNPNRAWRWSFSMAVGQSIAMAARDGSLSLWPLSIIAMTVCSIPQFLAGLLATKIKK